MAYITQSVRVTEARDSIFAFWKENFPNWPDGKLAWFYEQNTDGRATCFLVRDTSAQELVGVAAIFPRKFRVNGRIVQAGITGDFAISRKHRILGPAMQLQRAIVAECESKRYHFLYGFPNERSLPVQKRAGFDILGTTVRMVKVLRYDRYIEGIVGRSRIWRVPSGVLNVVNRSFGRESMHSIPTDLRSEIVNQFDGRFDELCEKSLMGFGVIGERNSKFLQFRYGMCPYNKYRIFAVIRNSDESLMGYVIYLVEGYNIRVVDFLTADEQGMVDNVLSSFCRFVRASKFESVSIVYLGQPKLIEELRKFGFRERRDKRNVVIYVRKNSESGKDLKNISNWYFLEGDND